MFVCNKVPLTIVLLKTNDFFATISQKLFIRITFIWESPLAAQDPREERFLRRVEISLNFGVTARIFPLSSIIGH